MLQRQELAQERFLRPAKQGHLATTLGSTHHRRQGNEQNLPQFVTRVGRTWIRQPSEKLLEFAHRTRLSNCESSSESRLRRNATAPSNRYAIPLPLTPTLSPQAGRGSAHQQVASVAHSPQTIQIVTSEKGT